MSNPERRDIILQLTADEAEVLLDLLGNISNDRVDTRAGQYLLNIAFALFGEVGDGARGKYISHTEFTPVQESTND